MGAVTVTERTLGDVLADLITDLQVPLSLPGSPLGAARAPLLELRDALGLRDWHGRDAALEAIRRRLGDAAYQVVNPGGAYR